MFLLVLPGEDLSFYSISSEEMLLEVAINTDIARGTLRLVHVFLSARNGQFVKLNWIKNRHRPSATVVGRVGLPC